MLCNAWKVSYRAIASLPPRRPCLKQRIVFCTNGLKNVSWHSSGLSRVIWCFFRPGTSARCGGMPGLFFCEEEKSTRLVLTTHLGTPLNDDKLKRRRRCYRAWKVSSTRQRQRRRKQRRGTRSRPPGRTFIFLPAFYCLRSVSVFARPKQRFCRIFRRLRVLQPYIRIERAPQL